jgi:hypothetical protein
MDLAFLLPARFLCSARCAASRYEVRFACDRVQRRLLGGHLRPATAQPMNAKLKAYGFAPLAVLLSAVELAWISGLAWYHLGCLRQDFVVVQSEGFHLAEHVEEKLLALNGTLRRVGVPRFDAGGRLPISVASTRVEMFSDCAEEVNDCTLLAAFPGAGIRNSQINQQNHRGTLPAKAMGLDWRAIKPR